MKLLLILNDAPYGIERTYNGLRIAGALAKRDDAQLKIFLMGNAVIAAVNGRKVPAGYADPIYLLCSIVSVVLYNYRNYGTSRGKPRRLAVPTSPKRTWLFSLRGLPRFRGIVPARLRCHRWSRGCALRFVVMRPHWAAKGITFGF